MFIKSFISTILAPIILIGGIFSPKPVVYVAPVQKTETSIPKKPNEVIATKATSTEKTKSNTKIASTTPIKKTKSIEKTTPPVQKETKTDPDFEAMNDFARKATVNIFCSTKGGSLSPLSGTGAIVTPKGLILTNAHIGQFFLLKDLREKDYLQCYARTGSPALPKYNLELVYISPEWISANKSTLKDENPKGTGENDFAFLRITGDVNNNKLPDTFPYIKMNVREDLEINEPVVLVAYPAGFLGGITINQNLNIASAITKIQNIFTFKNGENDLISIGGTILSQRGSSGGLVVDRDFSLIGIISTSTNAPETSDRELNAITLAHINRALQEELSMALNQFVSQDPVEFADKFNQKTAPILTKVLENSLK